MRANVMNSNKKSKKNFKSFVMSEIMCIFAASISRNRKQKRIITGRCQAFGRKKRSLALRIGEKVISFVPAKQEIHNNE